MFDKNNARDPPVRNRTGFGDLLESRGCAFRILDTLPKKYGSARCSIKDYDILWHTTTGWSLLAQTSELLWNGNRCVFAWLIHVDSSRGLAPLHHAVAEEGLSYEAVGGQAERPPYPLQRRRFAKFASDWTALIFAFLVVTLNLP